ncbi:MAG: type II CRISPR-associated endonuclease Cas1 [Bifidobacteriaceae bacterium]|jgi:CRISPR-associated endonuclease Cas1 subtype II|nr:type II CRISPR-associated endonuclease Cas1 [Bifidobacteriaceae bacterium]
MGFRVVTVNNHSKLSYQNNHLIYKSETQIEKIFIADIDVLMLETTNIAITTALLHKLIEKNVLVIFCSEKRLPSSYLMPYYARHDSSLQLQKQIEWGEDIKSNVFLDITNQKIKNQAKFLAYRNFLDKSKSILMMLDGLSVKDPENKEAHAARTYFNTLYGNNFSRELPIDINAGLDYGYTLLMSLFAREIVKCGCMTQLGINHKNQFNDFNFASDVMEPFRPLVDEIIYEYREKSFSVMKRRLLDLFTNTYDYQNQKMYLTNIVSDYTKKIIDCLHADKLDVPKFEI